MKKTMTISCNHSIHFQDNGILLLKENNNDIEQKVNLNKEYTNAIIKIIKDRIEDEGHCIESDILSRIPSYNYNDRRLQLVKLRDQLSEFGFLRVKSNSDLKCHFCMDMDNRYPYIIIRAEEYRNIK